VQSQWVPSLSMVFGRPPDGLSRGGYGGDVQQVVCHLWKISVVSVL